MSPQKRPTGPEVNGYGPLGANPSMPPQKQGRGNKQQAIKMSNNEPKNQHGGQFGQSSGVI